MSIWSTLFGKKQTKHGETPGKSKAASETISSRQTFEAGKSVPETGQYECDNCCGAAVAINMLLAAADAAQSGAKLDAHGLAADINARSRKPGSITNFMRGDKFTECPQCGNQAAWQLKSKTVAGGDASVVEMLGKEGMQGSPPAPSPQVSGSLTAGSVLGKFYLSLHDAAKAGDVEAVRSWLAKVADKEAKDKDGATPLHVAAMKGHASVVEMLVQAGADMDAREGAHGLTTLHIAASQGHASVVEVLIQAGANKEAKAMQGWTPLHVAAMKGRASVVEVLVAAGAAKEAKDENGWTPLWLANKVHNESVANILRKAGAEA
jgi:hypothetical protein